jgi:type VI secretion system secreted protein Hcp
MAYDAFLKIDGITGESTARGHVGEIQLDSFSFGVTNAQNTATSGEGGKAIFQDFHFTSKVGKHSPQLFSACVNGKPIMNGLLSLESTNSKGETMPDLQIKFRDVFFTEYKVMDIASVKLEDAVSSQGGLITSGPEDSASFSFSQVQVSSGGTTASVTVGALSDTLQAIKKEIAG